MIRKDILKHYIKRAVADILIVAAFAAAVYGISAKDLRIQRRIDGEYEALMPAPLNNVEEPALININTASAHQLRRITGVGETRAQAIVEYREEHGGFSSPEELINVSGIGEKTLETIIDRVTV